MDQQTALRRLRKALGPKVGYRINPKALDAEGRAEARAEAFALAARHKEAKEALDARLAELLRDPEYQRLKQARDDAKVAYEKAFARAHHKRITVGVTGSLFFSVKAEGDNWQEVVDAVTSGAEAT